MLSRTVTAWLLEETPLTGPLTVRLSGGCMEPLIRDGSTVRIVPAARYRAGDVVATLGSNNRIYAHRLLGAVCWRGRKLYLTQADKGSRADAATPHLLGRVEHGSSPSSLVRWRSRIRFGRALLSRAASRLWSARRV